MRIASKTLLPSYVLTSDPAGWSPFTDHPPAEQRLRKRETLPAPRPTRSEWATSTSGVRHAPGHSHTLRPRRSV